MHMHFANLPGRLQLHNIANASQCSQAYAHLHKHCECAYARHELIACLGAHAYAFCIRNADLHDEPNAACTNAYAFALAA